MTIFDKIERQNSLQLIRFIGLGEYTIGTKEKWMYAMNIHPSSSKTGVGVSVVISSDEIKSCTRSPFEDTFEDEEERRQQLKRSRQSFDNTNNNTNNIKDSIFNNRVSQKGSMNDDTSNSIPPDNYICHRCHEKGHWKQQCPLNMDDTTIKNNLSEKSQRRPPPSDYVCHKCNISGHWIQECSLIAEDSSFEKSDISFKRKKNDPGKKKHYFFMSKKYGNNFIFIFIFLLKRLVGFVCQILNLLNIFLYQLEMKFIWLWLKVL